MKKYYYLMVAMLATALVACGPQNTPDPKPNPDEEDQPEYVDASKESSMVVFLEGMALKGDTAIVVTETEEDPLTGTVQMGVRGSINCEKGFRVVVSRSHEGREDLLCGAGQCIPGDGEKQQIFNFGMMGKTSAEWYTHYTPDLDGDYKVTYKFINYNRTITIAVTYTAKLLY